MKPASHYAWVACHTLLWCLAIAVLVQNIVLLRQNRELRALAKAPDVEVGQRVAMSPGCTASQASKANFVAITLRLQERAHWKVVWVSRDSVAVTRMYLEKERIPFSYVLAEPTHSTYVQLGLESVPHVLAIRPDGTVDRIWRGRLEGENLKSLAAYAGA